MAKLNRRSSGILMSITSLPDSNGIGTIGFPSLNFIDFLSENGQKYWQILPLGPTGYGDSPYASFSTFAGNPLLIDLDMLKDFDMISEESARAPEYIKKNGSIDYGAVVWWKNQALEKAALEFLSKKEWKKSFEKFCRKNAYWLEDYALFTSIKKFYDKKAADENISGNKSMWNVWWPSSLARHEKASLDVWKLEHREEIEKIKAVQFFFYFEWDILKSEAKKKGVSLIGDIPIFVASDSCDFWANQDLFQIDKKTLTQTFSAGVPPDYFSATGQLWGNPLYDWDHLKETKFDWWVRRVNHMASLVDLVRIDHFRGFESYWAVPYGENTAVNGKWVKAPGKELFKRIKAKCHKVSIIAEDLGVLTPEVEELRDWCKFPGMKILQFAFNSEPWSDESLKNAYLIENFKTPNCVVYTGTHDNDTSLGALENTGGEYRKNLVSYLEKELNVSLENSDDREIIERLIELAEKSPAKLCIIPLQDLFALGSQARMNTPSTSGKNWTWRIEAGSEEWKKAGDLIKRLSSEGGRC